VRRVLQQLVCQKLRYEKPDGLQRAVPTQALQMSKRRT